VRDNGAVLSTHAFRPDGVDHVGHPGGLSGRPADGDGLWWLDLVDATDEELEQVGRQFELESLALDDLRLADQRPKLKLYPTHALVVRCLTDRRRATTEGNTEIVLDWLLRWGFDLF
jgi:Mg2+ and Co2+ transporter CorA